MNEKQTPKPTHSDTTAPRRLQKGDMVVVVPEFYEQHHLKCSHRGVVVRTDQDGGCFRGHVDIFFGQTVIIYGKVESIVMQVPEDVVIPIVTPISYEPKEYIEFCQGDPGKP